MNKKTINTSILLLFLFCFKVVADEYHYINMLNGSKATGLGGAYISVADDLTAMLYNPAGLSRSTIKTTASMNVLSWEETEFNKVFSDDSDFVRESFIIVPGYFAFKENQGKWDFGISFAVTDFSKERTSTDAIIDIPQNGPIPPQTNNEFIYIDLDNSAYKFGGSAAFRYSDSLSVGLSVYLQYKEFTTVQGSGVATTIYTPDGNLETGFNASRRISDLQISAQPILGILWSKDNLSIGGKLAYEIPIKREYEATASIFLSSLMPLPPQVQQVTRITEKTSDKQKLPLEVGLGISYQFSNFLISSDVNYFSEVQADNNYLEVIETPITRKLQEVINWSVGVEYNISKETAIRFGVFTDNSNGYIDTDINYQRIEDIDLLGFSSSVETSFMGNHVTFGLYYKQGTGDVRYADIRSVENIVGLPLYPDSGTNDIAEAKKKSLVLFLSLDF
ncbi:MAG: hypothetical protein OQK09_09930 [Colwellia sp.]|nr:hypothetical protein [Colwellia sp.]MCW9081816.1 hypothetical protein [Colwellia sp.]